MTEHPEADFVSELFDAHLRYESEFVEVAERLGISSEALEQTAAEMTTISPGGASFAYFCRHVIVIRRLRRLGALMRPGEESVSLQELAKRERCKGEA